MHTSEGSASANADLQRHWQTVYETRAVDSVSWYRPHLETSLRLLELAAPDRAAAVIDAGAGSSTLVDDLLTHGYRNLTLLDLSRAALEQTQARLGENSKTLIWVAEDLLTTTFPEKAYDVWHDRAVFHFLTAEEQRVAYLRQLRHALKPGGHVILGTFGAEGPTRCSGLEIARYDAAGQQCALGETFELRESLSELHQTPSGGVQQFQYGLFRRLG